MFECEIGVKMIKNIDVNFKNNRSFSLRLKIRKRYFDFVYRISMYLDKNIVKNLEIFMRRITKNLQEH